MLHLLELFFIYYIMNKGNILIVDDDKSMLRTLQLLLKHEFERVITISNPNRIPEMMSKETCDVILLDMNFSAGKQTGNEGIFWLGEILKIDPEAIVVMITAFGDIKLAVKAIKEGATDFILKPWDNDKLITTIKTGIKLRHSNQRINLLENQRKLINDDLDRHFKLIEGKSGAMLNILKIISKVANTDANILIMGENGTGKEVIAREIHRRSSRRNQIFVSVDLGSLSENLFESELFGHIKGAFTGAVSNRPGLFESARDGTLFLDEIGNLPLSLQAKLLTAIEHRKIIPLGSDREIGINVRLIIATNLPLYDLVQEGLFRRDLLYRINTVQIDIPPLRERCEDIQILAEYFLQKYSRKYFNPNLKFHMNVLKKLKSYDWPGNVRELEHLVEKAVILADDDILQADDFQLISHSQSHELNALRTLDEIENYYIKRAYEKHRGNLAEVARELNISRPTVYRKIKKYGL